MAETSLKHRLRELCHGESTLLWLEGSKTERVLGVSLESERLILRLSGGLTRVVAFERYAVTKVGLQFWAMNGRPGVLYRWLQVPKSTFETHAPVQKEQLQ